jgi:hypothetical protein
MDMTIFIIMQGTFIYCIWYTDDGNQIANK